MVLVDTSIWIDFFKTQEVQYSILLDQLLELGEVCTIDLIRAEIIPSAKNDKAFDQLHDYFSALPTLETPNDLWEQMMRNQYRLKRKGIFKLSIPDIMITTYALHHHVPLLTKDNDFIRIAQVLPLKLYEKNRAD